MNLRERQFHSDSTRNENGKTKIDEYSLSHYKCKNTKTFLHTVIT